MRRNATSWFCVLAVLAFAPSAQARHDPSTNDRFRLRGAAVNAQLQADLLSTLEPIRKIYMGNRIPLSDVTFYSRPYAEGFDGLCRHDELTLRYTMMDRAGQVDDFSARPTYEASMNTPLHAYGFEARPAYHALKPPMPVDNGIRSRPWAADCARLSGRDEVNWYRADDEDNAAEGPHWLQATVDLLRAGKLTVSSCKAGRSTDDCVAMVLDQAKLEKIASISSCASDAKSACFEIEVGYGLVLTIKGRRSAHGLDPAAIDSLAVEQEVVVT